LFFFSSFAFWTAFTSLFEKKKKDQPKHEGKKESQTTTTTAPAPTTSTNDSNSTPATSNTNGLRSEKDHTKDFIVVAAWLFIPMGLIATSLGRMSFWYFGRYNLPALKNLIFGSKTYAGVWGHWLGFSTSILYVMGGTTYLSSFEEVKETQSDGTVLWKRDYSIKPEKLYDSFFAGMLASLICTIFMAPGIVLGSSLGAGLVRRRLLINARKLQQEMSSLKPRV